MSKAKASAILSHAPDFIGQLFALLSGMEEHPNKVIPDILKREINEALSYYPDLRDVPIIFRLKKSLKGRVMRAQPHMKSFIKGRKGYIITISTNLKVGGMKLKITDLPKKVIVGWIGHELGHVMDYSDRSFFGLLKFGFRYIFSRKFLLIAERDADLYAIKHGLADDLVSAKNFILSHADLSPRYKEKIRRCYMSPEEVLELANTTSH